VAASKRISRTASSLLVSSLGLPGYAELMAAEQGTSDLQYRFTVYDESPLPQKVLANGDGDRYRINTHQFRFRRELDERFTLTVNGVHESMSGSSPWYVIPHPDKGPLQVMSGATIHETRNEARVSLDISGQEVKHAIGGGYSTENDYDSLFASYSGEYAKLGGQTTWQWGVSFADDHLSPTDAEQFGRITRAARQAASASVGLTRVINRNLVLQSGLQFTDHDGYLSDPYKEIWINGVNEFDHRPGSRTTIAWSTRVRQHLEKSGAVVHADYRYFDDDWGVSAHTAELAWVQPIGESFELSPSARYYSQQAADFYRPAIFDGSHPKFWSSDYRLSTYGAMRYRLSARWRSEGWSLALNADIYRSSESLAAGGKTFGTPGLVDYWRISLGWMANW
jgi:hypothetical protein